MERFKNLIRKAIAVNAEKFIVYAGQRPALAIDSEINASEDQEVFDEALFDTIFKTVLPKVDRTKITDPVEGLINIPGLGKLCVIGLHQDPVLVFYMPKASQDVKGDLANLSNFKKSWPYFKTKNQVPELNLERDSSSDMTFNVLDLPTPPPLEGKTSKGKTLPPAESQENDLEFSTIGFANSNEDPENVDQEDGTNPESSSDGDSMALGLAWGDSMPAELMADNPEEVGILSAPTAQKEHSHNSFLEPPPAPVQDSDEDPFSVEEQFSDNTKIDNSSIGMSSSSQKPQFFDPNDNEVLVEQKPHAYPPLPANNSPTHGALSMQAGRQQMHTDQVPIHAAPALPQEIDYGPDDPTLNGSYNKVMIDDLLIQMIATKSSDLHLTLGERVIYRIDGEITRINSDIVSTEVMRNLLDPIMPPRNRQEFLECNDTDFAYAIPEVGRFRVNIFRDRNGVGSVIRHIPSKILTMEQLKLPPICKYFCELSKGLVLVTGPTGSGKSTTLAAMLDYINRTRAEHLITVEDPIEFVHPQIKCLVNQREVHKHTKSFSRSLRAALREDPDIVLIGEMRDLETIAIAIETAETGHLVFGTLHTTTAVSTVDRIIDQFPSDRQEQIRMMLSSSLKGVVSQTLIKKIGGGRVAAQEILVTDDAVSAMIREGKNHMINNHLATQKSAGNQLLNAALLKHVQDGNITADDAYLKAVEKKSMIAMMQRANIKFNAPSETPIMKVS